MGTATVGAGGTLLVRLFSLGAAEADATGAGAAAIPGVAIVNAGGGEAGAALRAIGFDVVALVRDGGGASAATGGWDAALRASIAGPKYFKHPNPTAPTKNPTSTRKKAPDFGGAAPRR